MEESKTGRRRSTDNARNRAGRFRNLFREPAVGDFLDDLAVTVRHAPSSMTSDKAQVLAWITCDGVHIDPGTGKHTLLGIFSSIYARQFPVQHPYMIWFLTLTNLVPGKHQLRISIGLTQEHMTKILEREFESAHPNHRINLINELRGFGFQQPGLYLINVEVDDEPILVTNLSVTPQQ